MTKQTQRGSQHTTGPWHIGKHELQHRKTVYATDEWPVAEAISRNNRPDDEVLANARLIASVPELLKYAKAVMQTIQGYGPSIVPHLLDTDDNDGQRLREVIARAEGRA